MSQENVEVVRRCIEAWNQQKMEAVDGLLDDDVQIDAADRVFNPDEYRGRTGLDRFIAEIYNIWDEFRLQPEEFFASGDQLVVFVRALGRGKGSGVQVSAQSAWLVRLRDGKITSMRLYRDRDEALAAAGLSE